MVECVKATNRCSKSVNIITRLSMYGFNAIVMLRYANVMFRFVEYYKDIKENMNMKMIDKLD